MLATIEFTYSAFTDIGPFHLAFVKIKEIAPFSYHHLPLSHELIFLCIQFSPPQLKRTVQQSYPKQNFNRAACLVLVV